MDVVVEGHHSKCQCELCSGIRDVLGKDPLGTSYMLSQRPRGFHVYDYHSPSTSPLRSEEGYSPVLTEFNQYAPLYLLIRGEGPLLVRVKAASTLLTWGYRWARQLYNFLKNYSE